VTLLRSTLTHLRLRAAGCAAGLFLLLFGGGLGAVAQTPDSAPAREGKSAIRDGTTPVSVEQLLRRMQRLEDQNAKMAKENAQIVSENRSLREHVNELTRHYDGLRRQVEELKPPSQLPAPVPVQGWPVANGAQSGEFSIFPPVDFGPDSVLPQEGSKSRLPGHDDAAFPGPEQPGGQDRRFYSKFLVGDYDTDLGQYVLVRPLDSQQTPFELRLDFFNQARYTNFDRSVRTWTDSTGARLPVNNYSSVEVTRNFVQFQGFALDPKLQFTAIMFSSTAFNDTVFLGWMNYHFNDAFDLRIGNWLVPGTREWYESFRWTLGGDRLMATTFFRPNISPGIWAQGEPIENLHYVAMYANSLNRFNQGVERIGPGGAFGGTVWLEPIGRFGLGPSDNEYHERWTPRIGTSLAVSRETNQGIASPATSNPEDTILRLSDGTSLFRPGALGPNVLLSSAAVQVWTIDAAFKYRGFGLSTEYFLRWIDGFDYRGGRPAVHSLFDYGALVQGGYYLLPTTLETFARSSFVNGRFGGGYEVGGGVNWYVRGRRECRLTFEVLEISHSPAQNILTGYRAGESGTLYQLQWLVDF
jgi:hypothetical protein